MRTQLAGPMVGFALGCIVASIVTSQVLPRQVERPSGTLCKSSPSGVDSKLVEAVVKEYVRAAPAITAELSPPPVHTQRKFSWTEIHALYKETRVSDAYLDELADRYPEGASDLRSKMVPHLHQTYCAPLRTDLANISTMLGPGRDFPRVPIIADFIKWVCGRKLTRPRSMLSTAPNDPEMAYMAPERLTAWEFTDHTTTVGDLHYLNDHELPGQPFDFVLVSQTLEHLYDPFLCLRNIYDKMAPGGHFFTSAPALNMQHMTPVHFFHYTPMGLVIALKLAGFDILETGQFGNPDYETKLLNRHKWPGLDDLKKGPVRNVRGNPDHVWALAQKPLQP